MLVPTPVREVMVSPVETTQSGTTVRDAASRLATAEIGSLVVCEDETPVGILTDSDITRIVADGKDPGQCTVDEAMASELITTTPDTTIEAAARTLQQHGIKRLPVTEGGSIVGIVTTTDLSAYLPHLIRMGRTGQPDPGRERHHVRIDTAYEREGWESDYFGDESSIEVGDTVRFGKTITEADVEAFAEASGDTNRLHLDTEYAAGTRFGRRIVHGTLVGGTISAALARLPGLTIYLSQSLSYLGPVDLGDRVTADCEVVEDLGRDRYRLTTAVHDGSDELVVDGEAVVIVDPIPETA
ncbi:MAG: CBS domain-containing protein [Salinirussus sp.]